MGSKKINRQGINKGTHLAVSVSDDRIRPHVIFSLQHIQSGPYCFSGLDHRQKGDFADALFRRKDFTWIELQSNDHRKLGAEQLPATMIKAKQPACLTEDVEKYDVLRFSHNDGRIVGFRRNHIFHILWIDCKLELYDHGS
jgi:hypothetical protein